MRRYGWISLFALLVFAACGAPEVSDLPSSASDDDDDGGPIGDDDDDAGGTGIPTPGSTVPGGSPAPTVTNVPSFAEFEANIHGVLITTGEYGQCQNCHSEFNPSATDEGDVRYIWFNLICYRGPNYGMLSYDPPTGRLYQNFCDQEAVTGHTERNIPNRCALLESYFAGYTATPPNCFATWDLMNSE